MLERVVVTPRGRVPQLEEPLAKKADGHFSRNSLRGKGSGAPGETRTPGPVLRRHGVQKSKCRCWCRIRGNASLISPLNWTEDGLNFR